MKKKVLVIGGSYFLGRVFNILASQQDDADIVVVNRGRFQLNKPNITEFVSERHDVDTLRFVLASLKFDAVVDFCAYEPNDIALITSILPDAFKQYIHISTSSVYDPTDFSVKTEQSALASYFPNDPVSQYIEKKLLLESELKDRCMNSDLAYTIIRPSFIYGPFNYAPRESFFIEKIVKGELVPMPIDATSRFSMVYVFDVARALLACIGNTDTFGATFNSSAPDPISYQLLFDELTRCNGGAFPIEEVTIRRVTDENIPLPFPLDNDVLCDGTYLSQVTGVSYTSFSEGMDKTFASFKNVFS